MHTLLSVFSILWCALLVVASSSFPQPCGPLAPNGGGAVIKCPPDLCCSKFGRCGTGLLYCNPATCQPLFSGDKSPCSSRSSSSTSTSTSSPTTSSTTTTRPYETSIPDVDTCGGASNVSCPGAGSDGYYYRCCSKYGHCGPKNELQDQNLYCGAGCRSQFGNCETNRAAPPDPTEAPGIAKSGETCGPIVNRRCAAGLCCSGSNYCGTGPWYCGAANWCQSRWGRCD